MSLQYTRIRFLKWALAASVLAAACPINALFAHDLTTRVNISSNGDQGNIGGTTSSISGDGRYVAFSSASDNLVPGDTNVIDDIFVHDRLTGVTTRVSISSSGAESNALSGRPSISADGRFVAFESFATNLVTGDTNGKLDIFAHDRLLGTTVRASVSSNGTPANGDSMSPAISADGRYVGFQSDASNLVVLDTNGRSDVFVHDLQTSTTERVSIASNGDQGNGDSAFASLSADGRHVAFASFSSNFAPGDTNAQMDIFVHDRQTGQTTLESVDSSGTLSNGYCSVSSLSADGRILVFESEATNLVPGDTNDTSDIFWHDRETGETKRVSVNSNGNEGIHRSFSPSISGDGRLSAFTSFAFLVGDDTNNRLDIYVHDVITGSTKRRSVDSNGGQGNSDSSNSEISKDGRCVTFQSTATNLVPGDTNGEPDVFVRGPEFILDATPGSVAPDDLLTLTTYTGLPGLGASLWAVSANGTPIFALISIGSFAPNGTFTISGDVPHGLGAVDVTFRAYCFGQSGFVEASNDVLVSFLTG